MTCHFRPKAIALAAQPCVGNGIAYPTPASVQNALHVYTINGKDPVSKIFCSRCNMVITWPWKFKTAIFRRNCNL